MHFVKFPDIRLVVTDLDGTFLSSDKTMHPRNIEAVRKLQERGIYFSIATGRAYAMYESYVQRLALQVPVIACDGGEIRSPDNGSLIKAFCMDPVETLSVLDYAAQEKMDYITYAGEKIYFIENSNRIQRFMQYNEIARKFGHKEIEIHHYQNQHRELIERGVVKILLIESNGDDVQKMKQFVGKFKQLHSCIPEKNALDILSVSTSKGLAVKWLADYLKINMRQVCVLGDCFNDESMFELAGYSIAMGNADLKMQKLATAVTDTCDQAGFANAIEKYII